MNSKPVIACTGNCQGGVIRSFLLSVPEISRDYEVVLLRTAEAVAPVRSRLRIFIEQITHNWAEFEISQADLPPGSLLIRCPAALQNYPWPLIPFQKRSSDRGPRQAMFPYTICDDLVMRLAARGVPKEHLLEAYFEVDITRQFPLDRLRELNAAKARQIDDRSDFGLWDAAESGGQMFRTANHPNGPLLAYMLEHIVERLPLADKPHALKLARSRAAGVGIQSVEAPVHPQVADHFGLEWAKNRRWTFWTEGQFTFEEHLLRLYDFRFNQALHDGREALKARRLEEAAELLARAAKELPESEGVLEAYVGALTRLRRFDESVAVLRELIARRPTPRRVRDLVSALRRGGWTEEADQVISTLPDLAEHPMLLLTPSKWMRPTDPDAAHALLERAASIEPDDYGVLLEQASLAETRGDLWRAQILLERACYFGNWPSAAVARLDAVRARLETEDPPPLEGQASPQADMCASAAS